MISSRLMKSLSPWSFAVGLTLLVTQTAQAGAWGMLLGYNNPAGSSLGLNFLYQAPGTLGFEFGVGGLYGTTTESGHGESSKTEKGIETWGDIDVKWLPGAGPWRPYLEAGLAVALGLGSSSSGLAAGSPFVGGGLLFSGRTLLIHITADYKIYAKNIYPSAGVGFKF